MEHDEPTLRQMLEYIYTNRVKDMPGLSADEVIKLLALANGKSFAAGLLQGDPRTIDLSVTAGIKRNFTGGQNKVITTHILHPQLRDGEAGDVLMVKYKIAFPTLK